MKTILFADNDPDILMTRGMVLEKEGFQVLKAFTLDEAKYLLSEANIHLAILDIRMVNDDDDKDVSGLTLAREPVYRSIPKIIMTSFPSVQAVKDALSPVLDGLPPAVSFVAKDDGPNAMILAVKKALEFVRINWDLNIQWDPKDPLSFPFLIGLLSPGLPNSTLVHRADEMEDLIRRLFYEYRQVRLGQLLWHDSWRSCLPVLTRTSDEVTDLRILVYGDIKLLEKERTQLEKLAPDVVQRTILRGWVETAHFGANIYGLPGVNIETIQTLRDLFHIGKERPLKTAFDYLLGGVIKAWHRHGQKVQKTSDVMSLYRHWVGLVDDDAYRKGLEQRVDLLVQSARMLEGVEVSRDKQQMKFQLPQQPPLFYPEPVNSIYNPLAQYDTPVVCRVSPGRLTAHNILVDETQKIWLTDFALAGQAPQWWDFVCLEAAIRFELSQAPDLLAWQEFEECLVRPSQLDEKLEQNDVVPELRTSIALIEQIRQQAASETGSDILPYYAGLLAWTVEAMSHYDPGVLYTQTDRLRCAHLLLAAAMIASRLNEVSSSPPERGNLKLDGEGTVWLGTRQVAALMGLELDLLRYLYEHTQAGKLATRKDIVKYVYKEEFDPHDKTQEQRITALVSRLRDKIEPYPAHPRYLITSRGSGYRLFVNGEPEK